MNALLQWHVWSSSSIHKPPNPLFNANHALAVARQLSDGRAVRRRAVVVWAGVSQKILVRAGVSPLNERQLYPLDWLQWLPYVVAEMEGHHSDAVAGPSSRLLENSRSCMMVQAIVSAAAVACLPGYWGAKRESCWRLIRALALQY